MAGQNFRERSLWVRPSDQAWFDMADTEFDEQQWYENFRVTRDTFQFILNEIAFLLMTLSKIICAKLS